MPVRDRQSARLAMPEPPSGIVTAAHQHEQRLRLTVSRDLSAGLDRIRVVSPEQSKRLPTQVSCRSKDHPAAAFLFQPAELAGSSPRLRQRVSECPVNPAAQLDNQPIRPVLWAAPERRYGNTNDHPGSSPIHGRASTRCRQCTRRRRRLCN